MTAAEFAAALRWLEDHGHTVCIWDDDTQQYVPSLRPPDRLARDYLERDQREAGSTLNGVPTGEEIRR